MKVAIVGTGNVGWALATRLAGQYHVDQLMICSRYQERVTALIMEIASSNPEAAEKVKSVSLISLGSADLIVLTSGLQMKAGQSSSEVFSANAQITRTILGQVSFNPRAILITLATPVDDVTVLAQEISGLPRSQVIGFGGDLDRNRLEYVLRQASIECQNAELVGEHGGNAIPIYDHEASYAEVAGKVRGFLKTITGYAGETRNLATAILLDELICSVAFDSGRSHYVCGYHSDFEIYLTWKFRIHRSGTSAPQPIVLGSSAAHDLSSLIEIRKEKAKARSGAANSFRSTLSSDELPETP